MSDIAQNREDEIQELRKAMGTLPSEAPEFRTTTKKLKDSLRVSVKSGPDNPYVSIFESSCATWGDDDYESKWNRVQPYNRFRVCFAALTGNTLPQAIEVVSFLFHVRGTPRWLFEEHAREMSQFTTYLSVGCRDNSKLDASMVTEAEESDYFVRAKANYRYIIEDGQESWQSARTVLPMGYHHPYLFYTSLLCLMMNFRKFREREGLGDLLDACVSAVGERHPLLADCIRGELPSEAEVWKDLTDKDLKFFEAESI